MTFSPPLRLLLLCALGCSLAALAVEKGEEVELTSAQVTGLSCARAAKQTGKLELLTSCPLSEARLGLVVFDVAEKEIYKLSAKELHTYQLEQAYGGGSIDLSGVVRKVKDAKDGLPVVEVQEYRITPKPKAGSFKGCL